MVPILKTYGAEGCIDYSGKLGIEYSKGNKEFTSKQDTASLNDRKMFIVDYANGNTTLSLKPHKKNTKTRTNVESIFKLL